MKKLLKRTFLLAIVSIVVALLSLASCNSKDDEPGFPVVQTLPVSQIGETSVVVSGLVAYNGGTDIIEQGFVFNNEDERIVVPSGDSTFTVRVSNLSRETEYSVRAYAKNLIGISYGADISFTTSPMAIMFNSEGQHLSN